MCGINGILRLSPDAPPVDRGELLRARDAMARRGPDDEGEWIAADEAVGLGHRRLAIIDLSPGGHQPKSWDGGRYQLVFNGEIYNYRELRGELLRQGAELTSESDTEVILALYAREGLAALRRLRGMYAFGLWDAVERTLLLARDPYGIKPLYYGVWNGGLRFASQVRALEAAGASVEVDPGALAGFLLWGSVPEPRTLRRAIRAVPAGHVVRVVDGRVEEPRPHQRFDEAQAEPIEDVAAALEDSVRAHLVADVPVAVFLSAGLDSALIAALAARRGGEPLRTFTLRFDAFAGTALDEAPLAAYVARTIGAQHTEYHVERERFLDLWPRAIEAMDQPSIDGFNTFVVSRAAHESGLKVVLSGLGGDELFGSYESFADVPRWCRWVRRAERVPGLPAAWPWLAGRLRRDRPKLGGLLRHGRTLAGSYFFRRALFLPEELEAALGSRLAREGLATYDPVVEAQRRLDGRGAGATDVEAAEDAWRAVHVLESTLYMRNQLLRDSDWASMAHSLELRVPLVDPWLRARIAAARFEPARTAGKAALVRAAAPELPEALFSRPKTGFSIPVMEWLDPAVTVETARGVASRKLALRVLRGFGIDLDADLAAVS